MEWVFRARVIKVASHDTVDARFDLGFNTFKRKNIRIPGYLADPHLEKEAKDCLIILIGGHRIVAKPKKEGDIWEARVYLYQNIGMEGVSEVVGDKRLVCVNKVMAKAQDHGYDAEWLKKFFRSK